MYFKSVAIHAFALVLLVLGFVAQAHSSDLISIATLSELPAEAQRTVALIKRGGPYPFAKDGIVFGNYERVLPVHARGYYHEFTVKTPGVENRGAQRIIVGGETMSTPEIFYTNDHYLTFKRIRD